MKLISKDIGGKVQNQISTFNPINQEINDPKQKSLCSSINFEASKTLSKFKPKNQ